MLFSACGYAYCLCCCVDAMKRNRMCDSSRLFCLLLLNLEWHYGITFDATGSTKHTSHTQPFASLLYTEVHSNNSNDSDGSVSYFSHQSDTPKAESSTAATEQVHMSASDLRPHTAVSPSIRITEVSSSVSSNDSSTSPSATAVTYHSASDRTQFLSVELIASTPYPTTALTEISFADGSMSAMPESSTAVTEDAHTSANDFSAHTALFPFTHVSEVVSSDDSSSTPPREVTSHSLSDRTQFSAVEQIMMSASASTSYPMTTVMEISSTDSSMAHVPKSHTAVTDEAHMSVSNLNPHTALFLSTDVSEVSFSMSSNESSHSPRTTEVMSHSVSDRTQFSLTEQIISTPYHAMTLTDISFSRSSMSDMSESTTAVTEEAEMTTSMMSAETSPSQSTQVSMSSVDVNISHTISFPLTEQTTMNISTPLTEDTTVNVSTPRLSTYGTGTTSTSNDNDTTPRSSSQVSVSSADVGTSNTTSFLVTEQTTMNISTPRLSTYGIETTSTSSGNDTTSRSSTEVSVSSAVLNISNTTIFPLADQTSTNITTPCLSTYGTETTSTSSDNETILYASTQVSVSSVNVSISNTTSFPVTEQTTMNISSPCLSGCGRETTSTSRGNDATPSLSTQVSVSSADVSTSNTTSFPLADQTFVNITTPCLTTYGTETTSTSSDNDTTPRLSTQVSVSSADVGISDSTLFLVIEQTTVNISTPHLSTYGTDASSTRSGNDTTPRSSTQVSVSSADVGISNITSFPLAEQTTMNVSTPCLSTCGTETTATSSDKNDTTHSLREVSVSSADVSISNITSFPLAQQTIMNVTTPCLSTCETETTSTSSDNETTPPLSTQVSVSSADVGINDNTLFLVTEQTTMNVSTPCLTTYGTDASSTSSDNETTLSPSTQVTVSSANISISDSTLFPLAEQTTMNISKPCLSTYGTSHTGSDNDTTPWASKQVVVSSADVSTSNTTSLAGQTTMNVSTPCVSTSGMDMSYASTNVETTPCLSTLTSVHSTGDNSRDATQVFLTEETSIAASTPCPSTYETDMTSTGSDADTTPYSSTQAGTGSVSVRMLDTTPWLSTEDMSIVASTTCLSTYETDMPFTGSGTDTTPCPSTQAAVSSQFPVSSTGSTRLLTEKTSISASTPCPSTCGTQTSSTASDHSDVSVLSSSSSGITFSSTHVSYVSSADITDHHSRHPSVDLTAVFASTASPSAVVTDDFSSISSSHKTSRPVTLGSVMNTTTLAFSVESKVISSSSVPLSEASDSSSSASNLTTLAATDVMWSSADDLNFSSPCCSTESTGYSMDTTAHMHDTHALLSSTTAVTVTADLDMSELSQTAEYDLSPFTTTAVTPNDTTLANSTIGSIFFTENFTLSGITTVVPLTTSRHVTELLTATYDSASVSLTEIEVDTLTTMKLSYSTDGVTTTSVKYADLTGLEGVPSSSVSADFSESLHTGHESISFTVSPVVSTSLETLPSISAETETLTVSTVTTDDTDETELDISTDATSSVSFDFSESLNTGHESVSFTVSTSSETLQSYSAETVSTETFSTDNTDETELDVSTDATTSAVTSAGEVVYTTTEAVISSHDVTTAVTPSVEILFSGATEMDMSVSFSDVNSTSSATASTVVVSVPGDFKVQ